MKIAGQCLILLLCMLSGASAAQSASAQVLQLEHGREALAGHLGVFVDPDKTLTIDDVADPRNAQRFAPLRGNLNAAMPNAAVWLRFALQQQPEQATRWWLEVQPNTIGHVTLYVPDHAGGYRIHDAGSAVPFSQRDLRYRNPVFRLDVPNTQPQVFYLRLMMRGSVAPRLTVWRPAEFLEAVGREHTVFGIYMGVYAVLILASLWFERALRDGVYGSFGLCVCSCMLLLTGDSGLLFQYVFPDHPSWAKSVSGLIVAWSVYAWISFLFRFLDMPRRHPRPTRFYLGGTAVFALLVCAGVVLAGYAGTVRVLSVALTIVVAPLTFLVLLRPAWESASEIRYAFLITGVLMFLSLMVQLLLRLGYIERNWITEYAAAVVSLAFFLLIYYAISRRYSAMRAARDAAQKALVDIRHESGLQVERQVDARTEDLQRTMEAMEQALVQKRAAHEEHRQFIATISHELRTPLAVIAAATQNLARETDPTSGKAQLRLEKIRQASERLSSLLDTHLNSSRFDELSNSAAPVDVSLLPLLEDAIDAACPLADRHRFVLEKDKVPERIRTDPDLLRLVLRILADNAVKYTPSGSTVSLHAAQLSDGWSIEVADDGPGIPEHEQELIFERHYRGRHAGGKPGSGLGLALARRLVEMLGGTLRLASSPRGARFCIRLPDSPEPATSRRPH